MVSSFRFSSENYVPLQLTVNQVTLLLQVVIQQWDHYIPMVQDQSREMLVHLIHELVITKIDDETSNVDKRSIEDFVESVRRHDAKVIWSYDDNGKNAAIDAGTKVPESMSYVAGEVLRFFSLAYPGFKEQWGKVTLSWATSCPVRHLACRSFQLFRCILSTLEQQMLADMLARLSNTVADDEGEVQTFSMEILTTMRAIIAAMQPSDLIQYPQLFWTTCACLDTIHEAEFMEAMLMLDRFLDKVNLADPAVIRILEENAPEKWEGQFEGLARLVYKGIRSSVCLDRSLRLLERLVVLPSNRIVGDEGRLVYTVLANMPRYLQSFDQMTREEAVTANAQILAGVAGQYSCIDLEQALTAFANKRYRAAKDFVAQTMSAIRSAFFPAFEYGSLIFLLGLLGNKIDWMKINTMEVLCFIIPEIDMKKPEIASKGSDLISPLLRLLQTEFCPQALKVLDYIMDMTGEATPLERQHLRMSMAGGHSTRAIRKQYAGTQSLYGIPEESGWSIPVPAHHAHLTRANVHAVFYTCAPNANADTSAAATPKLEFGNEDGYPFSPPHLGNFPSTYDGPAFEGLAYASSTYARTDTMTSEDMRAGGESHIGELVMKLDSLDDFFENDDDDIDDTETLTDLPNSSAYSTGRYTNGSYASSGYSGNTYGSAYGGSVHSSMQSTYDNRENLYDQQTAPILHKSLTRNASVTSFHSGFADMRLFPRDPPRLDPGVMTPGAFSSFSPSATPATGSPATATASSTPGGLPTTGAGGLGARPNLHARSVTSPSAPHQEQYSHLSPTTSRTHTHSHTASTFLDSSSEGPDAFSDDDFATGRSNSAASSHAHPTAGTYPLEKTFSYDSTTGSGREDARRHDRDASTGSRFRTGMRSGMRRLTGTGERDSSKTRESSKGAIGHGHGHVHKREKSMGGGVPRVPLVPDIYLNKGPGSADP